MAACTYAITALAQVSVVDPPVAGTPVEIVPAIAIPTAPATNGRPPASRSLEEVVAPPPVTLTPPPAAIPAATNGAPLTEGTESRAPITTLEDQADNAMDAPPTDRQDSIVVSPAQSKMYEGMVHAQDKQYDQAIPKLEWAIKEDPTLLGAWETLGWCYWLTGRYADAKNLWERLLVIAPNEPMGYNLLAQVATRNGELDRAEELYTTSLGINPDQSEARLSYARVLLWNGKREKAVKEFRDLYRQDPDLLTVEIDLAWAMYANEEYEESLDHWNHICEMSGDAPEYVLARARTYILIGSLPEADADARLVLEMDKNNRGALNLLADIAVRARQPKDAVAALKKVVELAENDQEKARIQRRLAGYMKDTYDKDPTVFTLKQCVDAGYEAYKLYPEDINGRLFYGEILTADKQYEKAAGVFQEILNKLNPYNMRARQGLLETYFGRHMYEDVERQLNDNQRVLNASDPFQYVYWARLHFARGSFNDAMNALDQLEQAGAEGAVFTLLYHGLSPSEWTDMPSVRQFQDQMLSLRRAGFRFITPDEFEPYFKRQKAPPVSDDRPALNQTIETIKYSWTGKKPNVPATLKDHTPERVVCVTFDDGLRNSFRYATPIAEELQIRMAMFVPVGLILAKDMYVASFSEIRNYMATGTWVIGSHLMDASQPKPVDKEDHLVYPLPNLLWLPDRNRLESLREYYQRLRREFRESRAILLRELKLEPEELNAVSYPMGDIGQNTTCNIDLFSVPEVILNEASISYKIGFVQQTFGYALKTDNQLMLNRYEPGRNASGNDVVRAAFQQHPVFVARRMRVEMAALHGQLYMAQENLKLLKRDGYPEKDLAELNDYVKRHLARLAKIPDSLLDETEKKKERWFTLRHPYVGLEGSWTKANKMIDEWHAGIKAGVNINPRVILEARAGAGRISQEVTSNNWIEVEKTTVTSSRSDVTTTEDGQTTTTTEDRTTYSTVMVDSNQLVTYKYNSDESMVGLALNVIHHSGSLSIADLRMRTFTGDIEGESAVAFALEHQWRPTMAIDMAARFQHDLVPSARALIAYDSVAGLGIWRVFDWWHATGNAVYSLYQDDNSFLHAGMENFWRLSMNQDFWIGFHSSVDTVDKASDMYWSPYWDQRHYFIFRVRRSYPNYFGMVRVNLGWQKAKGRPEEMDAYYNRKARAETQGWYPGDNPDQDWERLVGIAASLTRKWGRGWELSAEFGVSSMRDYTEHNLSGSLLKRF